MAISARNRIEAIWKLFNDSPKPLNVPFTVGVVIDAHWPAIKAGGTLSKLYRAKIAPEQVNNVMIAVNNTAELAEKLWRPQPFLVEPGVDQSRLLKKGQPNPCSMR